MKTFLSVIGGIWLAAVLSIAAARTIARHDPQPSPFPLPTVDRCWEGVCFFDQTNDAVLAALGAAPVVVSIDAALTPASYRLLLDTSSQPDLSRTTTVIVSWSRDQVSLGRDWSTPNNPPLMTTGTLVQRLGGPERVSSMPEAIYLWYPARGFYVAVQPGAQSTTAARLATTDHVIRIVIPNPAYDPPVFLLDDTTSTRWRGFAVYSLTN